MLDLQRPRNELSHILPSARRRLRIHPARIDDCCAFLDINDALCMLDLLTEATGGTQSCGDLGYMVLEGNLPGAC
jgi:hypothetical protein